MQSEAPPIFAIGRLPNELLSAILDASTFVEGALCVDSESINWTIRPYTSPPLTRCDLLRLISQSIKTSLRLVLVSKIWHTMGMPFLFRYAIARWSPQTEAGWARCFLRKNSPSLASVDKHGIWVRRLDVENTVYNAGGNVDRFVERDFRRAVRLFVKKCPNLVVVTTAGIDEFSPDLFWRDVLRSSSETIRHIECGAQYFVGADLSEVIRAAPNLRRMELTIFGDSSQFDHNPDRLPVVLMRLLHSCTYHDTRRSAVALDRMHLPCLRHLTLDNDNIPKFLDDETFVSNHGHLITTLRIRGLYLKTFGPLDEGRVDNVLSRLPNLEELCIGTPCLHLRCRWFDYLREMAKSFTSTKIRRLGFYTEERKHQHPWQAYEAFLRGLHEMILVSENIRVVRLVDIRDTVDIRKHAHRVKDEGKAFRVRGVRLEGTNGDLLFN